MITLGETEYIDGMWLDVVDMRDLCEADRQDVADAVIEDEEAHAMAVQTGVAIGPAGNVQREGLAELLADMGYNVARPSLN